VSNWTQFEAEKAFRRAARARRRAEITRRLRRACVDYGRLAVAGQTPRRSAGATRGPREIPLDEITGTVEPNRAAQFDRDFRPAKLTQARWQRIWMAMHAGTPLPPISVVRVGDEYAVRDGHHRVSVAKWTGAATISAVVA
jgi:ParB-like nuclease domain